jgi:ABC-type multidrug transport system fused ATPase/permease subunit
MSNRIRTSLRSWPRALTYAKPHWKLAVLALLLVAAGAGVALLEPWPLAILVDSALGGRPLPWAFDGLFGTGTFSRVAFAVGLGLLITLLIHGVAVVSEFATTKLNLRMILEFRSELFQHVHRLSFTFHDDRRTGSFMGIINQEAATVGNVTVAAFPLLQSVFTLIGMFVIAYRLNHYVALVSLTVVPFIYYSTGYYGARIGPEVKRVRTMEMASLHIVHEAIQMLRVIVAFNREGYEYRRFRTQGDDALDARVRLTVRQTLFKLGVSLVTAAGTALVLGVGAQQVLSNRLTVGQLLVLISYIAAVYKPLETISQTINTIQEKLISFEMALDVLEQTPEVSEKRDAVNLDRVAGAVNFHDVSFSYTGRAHTLEGITFDVQPGSTVAIVGPTGAGKSTLVSLLPRFYDPAGGRISLDGVDLRDLTLSSLRNQMSIVLQEPLLFTGTILENIRYGRLNASWTDVTNAAEAANAHDFIMRLPNKYGTKLGERGTKISGGERQRIAVARAFLKDAPILILDEPTSSIDTKTESTILDALDRLMEGRTTFLIAHRLSTIRHADHILVVDGGKIVQSGTHDELLGADGLYRQLHDAQRSARATPAGNGEKSAVGRWESIA